jgi:hypothetical protein
MHNRYAVILILASVIMVFAGGCTKAPERTATGTDSSNAGATKPDQPLPDPDEFNLLDGSVYERSIPEALSTNADGSRLFILAEIEGMSRLAAYKPTASALGPPEEYATRDLRLHAHINAHPSERSCLVVTSENDTERGAVDVVWESTPHNLKRIPWREASGLPAELAPEADYLLKPLYIADGKWIVVPLNHHGFVLYRRDGSESSFIPYPAYPYERLGEVFQAVSDESGGSYLFVSFWTMGSEDYCEIYLFAPETREWVHQLDIPWLAMEVSGRDLKNAPWIIRGTRKPRDNMEHTRIPRLAVVDPVSAHTRLLQFWGQPDWTVRLSSDGNYACYADPQRQAVVRINPWEGTCEIDSRFFAPDMQLLPADNAAPLYVWHERQLHVAKFSEQEQFEPFELE